MSCSHCRLSTLKVFVVTNDTRSCKQFMHHEYHAQSITCSQCRLSTLKAFVVTNDTRTSCKQFMHHEYQNGLFSLQQKEGKNVWEKSPIPITRYFDGNGQFLLQPYSLSLLHFPPCFMSFHVRYILSYTILIKMQIWIQRGYIGTLNYLVLIQFLLLFYRRPLFGVHTCDEELLKSKNLKEKRDMVVGR